MDSDRFEFEETEDEIIVIDEEKLKREIAKAKSRNPGAQIVIVMDDEDDNIVLGEMDRIDSAAVRQIIDVAQKIKNESDLIEFDDDEE